MTRLRRRLDIPMTVPQPLADVLARPDARRNVQPFVTDYEAIVMGLLETLHSTEQQHSRFDRIDEWVRGVLCDALREDGVLPGKPPP